MTAWIIVLLGASFLLGAVPFGAIVARARGIDILTAGSRNIGATNVYRVLGRWPGLLVSILDILKGLVPALVAKVLLRENGHAIEWGFAAGMAAVVGHCFSPFLRLRGGKGVSTAFGALVGTTPWVALVAIGVFVVVIAVTRFVSLGSMLGAASLPLCGFLVQEPPILVWAYAGLAAFVVYRHRGNVKRLLAGAERRFELRGGEVPSSAGKDKLKPPQKESSEAAGPGES